MYEQNLQVRVCTCTIHYLDFIFYFTAKENASTTSEILSSFIAKGFILSANILRLSIYLTLPRHLLIEIH